MTGDQFMLITFIDQTRSDNDEIANPTSRLVTK